MTLFTFRCFYLFQLERELKESEEKLKISMEESVQNLTELLEAREELAM